MTTGATQPDTMAEIARLTAAIADCILEQHEVGASISPEQFRMFVLAAQILLENGVPWPASVGHLVMEVAKRVDADKPPLKADSAVVH